MEVSKRDDRHNVLSVGLRITSLLVGFQCLNNLIKSPQKIDSALEGFELSDFVGWAQELLLSVEITPIDQAKPLVAAEAFDSQQWLAGFEGVVDLGLGVEDIFGAFYRSIDTGFDRAERSNVESVKQDYDEDQADQESKEA